MFCMKSSAQTFMKQISENKNAEFLKAKIYYMINHI